MSMVEALEALEEYSFLVSLPEQPVTLIETIDRIKELRGLADRAEENCDYDPEGRIGDQCAVLRAAADAYEEQLHERLGWR